MSSNLLADDGYVLGECCKLLSFSREVLVKRFNDYSAVKDIQSIVESRMSEVKRQIDTFAELAEGESDKKKKKEMKIKAKVANKSYKYLDRTATALRKLVKCEPHDAAPHAITN